MRSCTFGLFRSNSRVAWPQGRGRRRSWGLTCRSWGLTMSTSLGIARSVLAGAALPVGIPVLFLADKVLSDLPYHERLVRCVSLLREYAGAVGYVDSWGHVVETSQNECVVWRFVPVELFSRADPRQAGTRSCITDLVHLLQSEVRQSLEPRLPLHLALTTMHRLGQRHPHALFGLVLADPRLTGSARRWIASELLPELLPALLAQAARRLRKLSWSGCGGLAGASAVGGLP